jgi:hypothetical protein
VFEVFEAFAPFAVFAKGGEDGLFAALGKPMTGS